jgi:hypothetical protein
MAQEEECEHAKTRLILAEQHTKLMQAEQEAREQEAREQDAREQEATDAASAPLKHQQQLNSAQQVVQQPQQQQDRP